MIEKWKPAYEFEGKYEVSNTGKVRSKKTGKILRPCLSAGYYSVGLCKQGSVFHRTIHRLVLESFVGPIGKRFCADHLDGNRKNNLLSNLRIVTYSENIKHGYRLGRIVKKGQDNNNAKINNRIVRQIRSLRRKGFSNLELAKRF